MPSCSVHGLEMALKPGGVSKKSGRPYPPFFACPWKDNGTYCSQTANVQQNVAQPVQQPSAPANEFNISAMMAKLERIEGKLDILVARQSVPAAPTPPAVEEVPVEQVPW